MIHVRREIPEHPVIDAMERWGYYPVRRGAPDFMGGYGLPRRRSTGYKGTDCHVAALLAMTEG